MTKDSRFHILLPITITDKDRQEILDKIDDLNEPDFPCLNIDSLKRFEDVDPAIIERDLELFRRFCDLKVGLSTDPD